MRIRRWGVFVLVVALVLSLDRWLLWPLIEP